MRGLTAGAPAARRTHDPGIDHAAAAPRALAGPELPAALATTAPAFARAPLAPSLTAWPRHAGLLHAGLAAWQTRLRRELGEEELPFVVVRRPVVDADRRGGGLAGHADHAAAQAALGLAGAGRRAPAPAALAGLRRRAGASPAAAGAALGTGLLRGDQDLKLSVLAHRVRVLLAEEPLVDQHVDSGGKAARAELALIEGDGAGVLLAAEDQLRLFLADGLVPPHGHRHGHHDAHDGDAHEERGHRVAVGAVEPVALTR